MRHLPRNLSVYFAECSATGTQNHVSSQRLPRDTAIAAGCTKDFDIALHCLRLMQLSVHPWRHTALCHAPHSPWKACRDGAHGAFFLAALLKACCTAAHVAPHGAIVWPASPWHAYTIANVSQGRGEHGAQVHQRFSVGMRLMRPLIWAVKLALRLSVCTWQCLILVELSDLDRTVSDERAGAARTWNSARGDGRLRSTVCTSSHPIRLCGRCHWWYQSSIPRDTASQSAALNGLSQLQARWQRFARRWSWHACLSDGHPSSL